eukprot:scaffold10583_cov56-Skeletonema_menzelii.AAC.1
MVEGCLNEVCLVHFLVGHTVSHQVHERGSARKTSIGESLRPPADDVPRWQVAPLARPAAAAAERWQ